MLSTVTSNGSTTNAHLKSSLDPAPVGRLIERTFGDYADVRIMPMPWWVAPLRGSIDESQLA